MLSFTKIKYANPSGSEGTKEPLHAQRIEGDHSFGDYNPSTSHRHLGKFLYTKMKRYAGLTGNCKKQRIKSLCGNIREPFVKPINQNVKTAKIFWMGVLASSNNRRHGILDAITA